MLDEIDAVVANVLHEARIYSRQEVLSRPSPIPAMGGVYGWWFSGLPPLVDRAQCLQREGLTLLYVGISPTRPPRNGRPPSSQNLRTRIQAHYGGNAEGSALRKTLGCLLCDELGIELRRVGSGKRKTFVLGEQTLSAWMAENAFVSWAACSNPWRVEEQLIAAVDLPLNLDGDSAHTFHPVLSDARSRCVARANGQPILPNPGVGGR